MAGGFNISGVDFGCYSTLFGQCEGLKEREEQVDFHAFFVVQYGQIPDKNWTRKSSMGMTHPIRPKTNKKDNERKCVPRH